MLELVFIFLLIGIIHLLVIPRDNILRVKKTALEWSLLTLTATILLWASFDGEGQFQTIKKWSEFRELSLHLGRFFLEWMGFQYSF